MAQIAVLERKCTGCGLCSESCPFGAIDMKDGKPELNAACRVCGICVKTCPEKAMIRLETRVADVYKRQVPHLRPFPLFMTKPATRRRFVTMRTVFQAYLWI